MLCIVCSCPIPIPIYRDENKLCKSCASKVKLKDNLMEEICKDADLENVQRQLLHDLNLEEDSDYEAELNYLREAKKTLVLSKEKKLQSFHSTEFRNDPIDKLKSWSDILAREHAPKSLDDIKTRDTHQYVQETLSSFEFDNNQPTKNDQKMQKCDCNRQANEKVKSRIIINRGVHHAIVSVQKPSDENPNQSVNGMSSVACRAVFRSVDKHKEPVPQFEKINPSDKCVAVECETIPPIGNKNPFICPVTFCKNIIPVSDLIKHFKLNHIRVPLVPVTPGACINLFWETKVDTFGSTQCLMLLLSTKTCRDVGDGIFKDSIPIAIMTTKVRSSDLTDVECGRDDGKHFYLIWLTAMSPSVEPVYYTIAAWSGAHDGLVHVVNTTQSYSIRADQNPKIVYRSGMVMVLTSKQINGLSNGNQDMVKLQVVVH